MDDRSHDLIEAIAAADELIEAARTLADLITEAAGSGREIVHWTTAREIAKKRHSIPRRDTNLWHLWIGAAARPVVTLEQFVSRPAAADWELFGLIVSAAASHVSAVSAELARQSETFPTAPHIAEPGLVFARRQGVLDALARRQPPVSQDEWTALGRFLARYVALADALYRFNYAIARYVERLKADGKWPIRGD